MPLTKKAAIVTGATSYVGRAVSAELAAHGWQVVAGYRNQSLFDALRPAELSGEQITGVQADTATAEGCQALVRAVPDGSRLSALVNVAGGFALGSFEETDDALWHELYGRNLQTAISAVRAVAPVMAASGGGAIVNVGSKFGLHPFASACAYSVMKAALNALTVCLARELAPGRVRVNCVAPGTIDTETNRQAMPDADTSGWVDPARLAAVIRFLIEDESADMTGAVVPVFSGG